MRPGPPRNVTATNVTDTSVTLSWEEPVNVGTPPLALYHVIIRPSLSPDVVLDTTNTSITIEDKLIPVTVYNFSVVGVSSGDNFDRLVGEESNIVTFETETGGKPHPLNHTNDCFSSSRYRDSNTYTD